MGGAPPPPPFAENSAKIIDLIFEPFSNPISKISYQGTHITYTYKEPYSTLWAEPSVGDSASVYLSAWDHLEPPN